MKLQVKHLGKEIRTKFEKSHPVLRDGDRMKAELKHALKSKTLSDKKK